MILDVSHEKDLFRHLGFLSNEMPQIQKSLQTIDAQESRLRAALDELGLEKDILIEQAKRLETFVKQAATSAVEDDERERERQQSFEDEKSTQQTQMKELEETLQMKEAAIKDLQEQFTAEITDLNEQISEKNTLLQVRDIALKDFKAASESLNRLISTLSSSADSPVVLLEDPQDNPTGDTADVIKEIEERTSMEIERLKRDIHEKELALAAKSAELEMTTEKMGNRIEELENTIDQKKKKTTSPRLVSRIADMSVKRFM